MRKVIVKLDHFSKSFGDKKVIDDITLDIYEKEFITILGPSGCGKTTILRSISGLDNPTKGDVYLDGKKVTYLEPQKRQVNTIFQNYALFPLMSVYDNIAYGLRVKKVSEKQIKEKVTEILSLVHLEGYKNRKPKELSGGEQQRVSLARGLVNNPKVLLLDEPLSALDMKIKKEMKEELKLLQKKLGITFIYVTHDQSAALTMSDRIVVLENGKIKQIGTPKELYENPNSFYIADFLGEANIISGIIERIKDDKAYFGSFEAYNNNFSINDKVILVIRPENIKIVPKMKRTNAFQGTIISEMYDGSFTKLIVKVEDKKIKVLIMGPNDKYHINDEVFLTWNIEDSILLRDNNE